MVPGSLLVVVHGVSEWWSTRVCEGLYVGVCEWFFVGSVSWILWGLWGL